MKTSNVLVFESEHGNMLNVIAGAEDVKEVYKRYQVLKISLPCLKYGIDLLRIVKLNGNKVKSVPNFSVLQHLKELYLSGNEIEKFPQWLLQDTFAIDILDISNNPLFKNAHMFQRECQGTIKNLNLSTTNLTRKNILVLKYFRSNRLSIGNDINIKYNQNSNEFYELSMDDFYDNTLELNASFSNLEFSPDLSEMKNLEVLNLSGNAIAALSPKTIISSLRILILNHCKIYHLPNMQDLVSIQVLDLSHNEITWLPPSINKLSTLTHLDLYNNMLTSFPDIKLNNLIKFDICQNYFQIQNEIKINNRFYFDLKRLLRTTINKQRKNGEKEVAINYHEYHKCWNCEDFSDGGDHEVKHYRLRKKLHLARNPDEEFCLCVIKPQEPRPTPHRLLVAHNGENMLTL